MPALPSASMTARSAGSFEGIAAVGRSRLLSWCLEHASDVAEKRFEHRAVVGIEALGLTQFVVQAAQRVLKVAHGCPGLSC